MYQVLISKNPFDSLRSAQRLLVNPGQTIRDWLTDYMGPDFVEFDRPTICVYNGKMVSRALWKEIRPAERDVVVFAALPQDPTSIVLAIIAIIAAIVAIVMMPDPGVPQEGISEPEPAYKLDGQYNRRRLGSPIEDIYGKNRVFCSQAANSYTRYINGESYQHSLYSMGWGEFVFHKFQLDDTETDDFEDVTLEIVPPGGAVTLFETAVYSAAEVANLELFGPNQAEFEVFGPYTVNDANTTIDKLEVDVTWPSGLYRLSKNLRYPVSVITKFEYRKINIVSGAAEGSWTIFSNETVTRKTNSPVRLTFAADVANGRYEVRGQRVSNKPGSTEYVTTCYWEAARGVSNMIQTFPGETIIAMRAKATNNLNSQTRQKFNVLATRKLPIWNNLTGLWSAPTATQNPIWAALNIYRAPYGGQVEDEYLDLETFFQLATVADEREDTFNWVFDTRITVWEGARQALRVMRTMPIPQGSLITAVRDEPKTLVAGMFNQHNIAKKTLKKNLLLYQNNPYDCLIVEYTNEETANPEEVLCQIPGKSANNPDKLKLAGCSSRAQAYHEGMLILARRYYCRTTLTFETGMEGQIPSLMDVVSVTHPIVRLGSGGAVMAYNTVTNEMTLSERVSFAPGYDHYITLRSDVDGSAHDPILVTAGSSPNKVILASDPPETLDFGLNRVPPLYQFGAGDWWAFKGNVTRISPKGQRRVELTVVNYDARVFDFDELDPPVLADSGRIRDEDAPTPDNVVISSSPDNLNVGKVTWKSKPGAQRYRIEQSLDNGDTWDLLAEVRATVNSYEFTIVPGDMMIRVAAVGGTGMIGGYGTSVVKTLGITGTPPAAPVLNATQPPFTGLDTGVTWQPSTGAGGYSVEVHLPGDPVALRETDVYDTLEFEYDINDMLIDNGGVPSRDLEFWVFAYNTGGSSTPAAVRSVSNAKPAAPGSPTAVLASGSDYNFDWNDVAAAVDFDEYRLYGSTVPGFTPGIGNLLYAGPASACTLTLAATLYWRVAAFDQWAGSHTDANFTAEQTRAYP